VNEFEYVDPVPVGVFDFVDDQPPRGIERGEAGLNVERGGCFNSVIFHRTARAPPESAPYRDTLQRNPSRCASVGMCPRAVINSADSSPHYIVLTPTAQRLAKNAIGNCLLPPGRVRLRFVA
jgi:hypothetical protein